jgi:hypothetical protein
MSFWGSIGRWLDNFFSGGSDHRNEVDPQHVDAAIRLIQQAVDSTQRERKVHKLRVADLPPERQAELAQQLAELLKKPEGAASESPPEIV